MNQELININEKNALYTILGFDIQDPSQISLPHNEFLNLLKKKYRRAAIKYHPDSGGLEENFLMVGLAHEILGNEESKKWYDEEQDGIYTQESYANFNDMHRLQSNLQKMFIESYQDQQFVSNIYLNKVLNIGWKIIQIGILIGIFSISILADIFWLSSDKFIHYIIAFISFIGAYLIWGRWISCWCLTCWCFAPWTLALLIPVLYYARQSLWEILYSYFKTDVLGRMKWNIIAIGVLELLLKFIYGYTWISAFWKSTIIVIFFPLIIILFASATIIAQLFMIPVFYALFISLFIFFFDLFVLHWFPFGFTSKLLIAIWLILFVLSSPTSFEAPKSENFEEELYPSDKASDSSKYTESNSEQNP